MGKNAATRDRQLNAERQRVLREHQSRLEIELETTARRLRRRIEKAVQPQRAAPPRAFALCACLFGDGPFLSKYVLGAVELASELKPPWALWIVIDNAALELWGAELRRLPNVHLVRMTASPVSSRAGAASSSDEASGNVTSSGDRQAADKPMRSRRHVATSAVAAADPNLRKSAWTSTNNTPHLLARYLLLDDTRLAAAIVIDLDVHAAEAVAGHMALMRYASQQLDGRLETARVWAATDLLRDDGPNSATRVARTSGGVGRYNAGAVFMANPLSRQAMPAQQAACTIESGIASWVKAHTAELGHGCDERWLEDPEHAPLVPAIAAGNAITVYVEGLRHGGVSTLPRTHPQGRERKWCLGESSLGLRGADFDAVSAAKTIRTKVAELENEQMRNAHNELTGPSQHELSIPWMPDHTSGVVRGS